MAFAAQLLGDRRKVWPQLSTVRNRVRASRRDALTAPAYGVAGSKRFSTRRMVAAVSVPGAGVAGRVRRPPREAWVAAVAVGHLQAEDGRGEVGALGENVELVRRAGVVRLAAEDGILGGNQASGLFEAGDVGRAPGVLGEVARVWRSEASGGHAAGAGMPCAIASTTCWYRGPRSWGWDRLR